MDEHLFNDENSFRKEEIITNKKILVVDDDHIMSTLLKKVLEKHYHVELAVDGVEGWKSLEKSLSDIVLLDIQMPRMDGFELYGKIKQEGRTKHIPVIFMSAFNSHLDEIKKTKCEGYHSKPIILPKLLEDIKSLLKC